MLTKILIVGPAWVGDMVMAQTLFSQLQRNYPGVLLDVLAPAWSRPLLERMPEVHHAIELPFLHGQLDLYRRYTLAQSLKAAAYDQAIVLPNSWKSALIPWWAGIPLRTGWRGEYRYGLLNDIRRLDKARYPLMVQRFVALGLSPQAAVPIAWQQPHFQVQVSAQQATLQQLSLKSEPNILALCPGAEFGPAKRWPAQYFADVAKVYLQRGWQVWIFGSTKDTPIAVKINNICAEACVELTGKTSLGAAIDLMALAKAVVSNDSGLMHIAAALSLPLVALYGSSSADFTPPQSDRAQRLALQLACRPCFKRVCPLDHLRCLNDLMPAQVLAALDTLGVS